jgi:uncharacterized membrane protein
MRAAMAGPIPGMLASSSRDAVFMSTGLGWLLMLASFSMSVLYF